MASNVKVGVDSKVVCENNVIKGLNKLGFPSITRNVVEIKEFGEDFDFSFTADGKFGTVTFGGNMVVGDTNGQDKLKAALVANTKLTDIRFYIDKNHFMTCDLANDPASGFQVSKADGFQADKSGLYPYDSEMVVNGKIAYFYAHSDDNYGTVDGSNLAFVQGTGSEDTITDSDSGFVTEGFKAGQTLIIEGSTSNDGQYIIKEVAAGTLTLTCEGSLTAESGVTATILHGGKL